ncbi:hypothetical protein LV457_05765 [Mycobacterium sp. MYCO198283]|uniref:hypothetical protein n=1 Tax=Mycobacterium sp. MYCO198283 TaxID=2883505 RepID=UPI001E496CCC|nr:hypothetical protein [Mycobacterium sp. MYCO198283]MCG5431798.1 hypothetical protein [Mycobacterium sp. MYCO198283]
MPRLYDDAARAARDAQLLRLYLAGHSYRAMAAQPGLDLSLRGVVKAVRRQLAAGLDQAAVAAAFAAAYRAACAGDPRGARAVSRLLSALGSPGVAPPESSGG